MFVPDRSVVKVCCRIKKSFILVTLAIGGLCSANRQIMLLIMPQLCQQICIDYRPVRRSIQDI